MISNYVLPNGWEIRTVEELVSSNILYKPLDGNHGEIHPKSSDYVDFGVPFIMASDLSNGRVNFNTCKFISEEQAKTLRKGFAMENDVLISHKATIGRTAFVQQNCYSKIVLTPQVTYYRVKNIKKLHPQYLKYYFDSYYFQDLLLLWSGAGSTRAYLGITGQLKLPIVMPPIELQKQIGDSLWSIDMKIENNLTLNQTLESISQSLFKSWFVDFDPVKAKIEAKVNGKDPFLAAMEVLSGKFATETKNFLDPEFDTLRTIAALFPAELIESELGLIPKGWEIKSLDKIADFLNGLALQNFPIKNDFDWLPVIKISQLKKGDSNAAEKASSKIPVEYIVDNGDVIFSWSGSLHVDVWCGGKGALNQHLFKVTSSKYPKWFYYQWTLKHLESFQRIAADKAVTMGHIKREHLTRAKCIVPSELFFQSATPLFENLLNRAIAARLESSKLSDIRDTLIPKLLNGDISIK
jgi:type I restriction enzyme, S subunit